MISNSLLSNKQTQKKELLIKNTSEFCNTILIALKSCLFFFVFLKLHRSKYILYKRRKKRITLQITDMQTTFNTKRWSKRVYRKKKQRIRYDYKGTALFLATFFWWTEPWCFRYMLECKDSNSFSVANNILHMVCQRLCLYGTKFDCKIQQQRM